MLQAQAQCSEDDEVGRAELVGRLCEMKERVRLVVRREEYPGLRPSGLGPKAPVVFTLYEKEAQDVPPEPSQPKPAEEPRHRAVLLAAVGAVAVAAATVAAMALRRRRVI